MSYFRLLFAGFMTRYAKNLDDLATFVKTSVADAKIGQLPFLKKF
jgi:hypothetical protein